MDSTVAVLSSCLLSPVSISPFGTSRVCQGTNGNVFQSSRVALTILFVARNLKVPVYQLLGGKVRNKVQVYAWIGGDRPKDIEIAA